MDGHSNGLTKTKSEDQHSPLNDAGLDEIKKNAVCLILLRKHYIIRVKLKLSGRVIIFVSKIVPGFYPYGLPLSIWDLKMILRTYGIKMYEWII